MRFCSSSSWQRYFSLALLGCVALACQSGLLPRVAPSEGASDDRPTEIGADGTVGLSLTNWWSNAVAYEIFVRSFQDSDQDGIGDLRGLLQRLDHLNDGRPGAGNDLEVGAIWLMPIHPSPSYHGYDVLDYRAVHPDYGSLEDMRQLIEEAHRRGIRVIMDFVVNHTSNQHPWFLASAAKASEYRDYFLWRDAPDPRWKRPWDGASVWHPNQDDYYLGLFWGGMPDLNLENPAVFEELASAMEFWLDLGVDGFRLDAVRHLVEEDNGTEVQMTDTRASHEWLKRLRRRLITSHPDVLILGEAWSSPRDIEAYAGEGDELHMAFSFGLASGITDAVMEGQRVYLHEALEEHRDLLAKMPAFSAPFLTNHDMKRFAQRVGADRDKLHLAAAILLTMQGTPFVYYGEELGLRGAPGQDDRGKRTPMLWEADAPQGGFSDGTPPWIAIPDERQFAVSAQQKDPSSLLHTYRQLIQLRNRQPEMRQGQLRWYIPQNAGRGALVLLRESPDEGKRIALALNLHSETDAYTFSCRLHARDPHPDGNEKSARTSILTPSPAAACANVELLWGRGVEAEDVVVASDRIELRSIRARGFAFFAIEDAPRVHANR